MAVVVQKNHSSRRRAVDEKAPHLRLLVYLVGGVAVVVILLSIFGPTLYLVQQQQQHKNDNNAAAAAVGVVVPPQHQRRRQQQLDRTLPMTTIVQVDELKNEDLFRNTIKNCLPSESRKKCGEFVPDPVLGDNKKTKVQRVAVIAPPGDLSDSLLNRVEQIANEHNKHRQRLHHDKNKDEDNESQILDIDVIHTTHVPPYGYGGKTHGYTKIIRLIPEPLVLETTDALSSLLRPGETHKLLTINDLIASFRIILRFHCRLSHVAAHTALFSVSFMDLMQNPSDISDQLRQFLLAPHDDDGDDNTDHRGPPAVENKIGDDDEDDDDDDDDDLEELMPDDDSGGLMDAELAYGSQILTHIQQQQQRSLLGVNDKKNILDVLNEVLLEELKTTDNMKKWPCPSFWDAAATATGKSNEIVQRLAKALSPDCDNDPYAHCWVERDKCEYRGDAICPNEKKKQKK